MNASSSGRFPVDTCYPIRVSEVGYFHLISVGDSSIVQFGDRADLNASLRALAVQRQSDHLLEDDVYFEAYSIFSRPRQAYPSLKNFDDGYMTVKTCHLQPRIHVGCIEIIAASASASILIGNGRNQTAESRIKHIRQYAKPPSTTGPQAAIP
ncbi:spore germination protein GerPE [Paenibacillus nasutitermitis]|uniref:spore germination protein GerPE n=1 Tax=Paenibacillus nasutitermitis TaxID=1652958 RepID=UPI001E65A821|nr:spore germination protein GerPE [Paenibacillus nasutitermitis]